jgi:chromosomal replication initiator protein
MRRRLVRGRQRDGISERVPEDLSHAWPRIVTQLRREVPAGRPQRMLDTLEARELVDQTLVLAAPDRHRAYIADRFGRVLTEAVQTVLGPETRVEVVPSSQPTEPTRRARRARPTAPLTSFNPKYTFEQYVIGDGNRLAHGAALAVAEQPAQAYNPLFVYGPPGVGKTHLLHSIGNYLQGYGAGVEVRYTTVEEFTNAFITALQSGGIERFKDAYRSTDVLLIDDVQFLASKARTEEEFFHTFNALYEGGSQLVLTSDRLPRDLDALEDRLRERFECGLVTDVRPPDRSTRITILRKRVAHDRVELADDQVVPVIADCIVDNVRVLEGALIRVVAYGSLTGRALTGDLAAEVLTGLYPVLVPARRTIREIQLATCEAFGITMEELLSPSRVAKVTWPRQVAMYLSRELTDRTLPAIGDAFGGRDHSTVLHAVKRTTKRIASDADAYDAVQALTDRLRTSTRAGE